MQSRDNEMVADGTEQRMSMHSAMKGCRGDSRRAAIVIKDRKMQQMASLLTEAAALCALMPSSTGDHLISRIGLVIPGLSAAMDGERISCGTQRKRRNAAEHLPLQEKFIGEMSSRELGKLMRGGCGRSLWHEAASSDSISSERGCNLDRFALLEARVEALE